MMLIGSNIFMSCHVCLVFDLQRAPDSGKNWGIITSSWTPHQTWWTSVPDQATDGLAITDQTPFSDQADSCFIFLFDILLHWCLILKDHHIASFFCLVYAGISLVGNWGFFNPKNHLHLILIGRDFHYLVLSDNLNEHGADWIHHLQA
jgi:hypothetical protein